MADIRLVQARGPRLWVWTSVLAAAGLVLWGSAFFFGDATDPEVPPQVGAEAGFGERRTTVLPAQATPLHSMIPLRTRDLGRLVRINGVAESRVAGDAVWIRMPDGHRILVRFEPAPSPEDMRGIGRGSSIALEGYLEKISRAELLVWLDTLGVRLPRPSPGVKFGDLPDPAFARVDSLFVKNFYVSVRPEALRRPAARPAA